MAPRTNQWLQERTWDTPTKGLLWTPALTTRPNRTISELRFALTETLKKGYLPIYSTDLCRGVSFPVYLKQLIGRIARAGGTSPRNIFFYKISVDNAPGDRMGSVHFSIKEQLYFAEM